MPNEPYSIGWRRAFIILAVCSALILLYPTSPAARPASSAHVVVNLGAHPDEEDIPPEEDLLIQIVTRERGAVPRVLIYHTHTYEAYEPTPENLYVATEQWRTKDSAHNIIRVGEVLAEILRDRYGMDVVHDLTEHEPPQLSSSYTRSLKTLDAYTQRGETFDLYIDLHRDAYTKKHSVNTVTIAGEPVARLMMLIGKGEGQSGVGYAQKPDWKANLAFAETITKHLNALVPTLADPVTTKPGRFNQHISTPAILVEAGNNLNTLEEVLRAMPYLAEALDMALDEAR